ncbi:hypothetical protein JHD50_01195 [Sulfurimonas sp. MAG313]|nr:hypothetical protein [Sulfurimonas sp. MAG313]MDF1879927.1 hypothetical protein [Sulfurimonas sp. MAG313]
MKKLYILVLLSLCVFANEAQIQDVKVSKQNDTYSFSVKILHEDSGWKHYVDGYEVLDKDGNILAKRVLWHPHEHEQPFIRSLNDVKILGFKIVFLRAHDSVDGYSELYEVFLP